jgi:hypothetical protein
MTKPNKWNRRVKKVKWLIRRSLPIIDFGDYRQTVLLAGVARSGTTWVANIINYKNKYRLMFEPFHSKYVELMKDFRWRQYLRLDNKEEKFLKPVEAILSGNIRNKWIDKFNRKQITKKRIIKEVRNNLLLKWMKINFPEVPFILLLRHPCAVALSRIKLKWGTELEHHFEQEQLMEDFFNPFKTEIEQAETDFEKQIFQWCVENYVPLKQFSEGQIHLAFYENFCVKPEQEVSRLFGFLNQPYDDRIFKSMLRPSNEAFKDSAIRTGGHVIEGYKNHLSTEQIKRAIEILSLFGLDKIYGEEPMPLVNGSKAFLAN